MTPKMAVISTLLAGGALLVTSCAPAPPPAQAGPPLGRAAAQPSSGVPGVALASFDARPPPRIVTQPMAGEPASLDEVRLVTASCEEDAKQTEELVAKMRAELDAAREQWKQGQPACWEEKRAVTAYPYALGDAFGAGGLGLTGIGEGGGGRGEGIGLGSIGTLGHGAGVGNGGGLGTGRSGAPKKATSTSKTNNQIEGVDEADIVKTDGTYLYLASNGALRIAEALNPRIVSVTKLGEGVRELFVEGDTAVVYTSSRAHAKPCTYGYDCSFAGDGSSTTISVLDISNRAAPRVTRTIALSGSLMTARRVGRTVHTVVADGDADDATLEMYPDIDPCNTDWHVVYEKFTALKVENERKIREHASGAYGTPAGQREGGRQGHAALRGLQDEKSTTARRRRASSRSPSTIAKPRPSRR
ncbi:MAG: beta-propeller domain-containing protein [Polyangiaceae bacterium]